RRRSTSVKPPVEAPMSAQTRPAGSTPNASSAGASFSPPRLTYRGPSTSSTWEASATLRAASRTVSPATLTLPARISAWAFWRDSTSPDSTSTTSSRSANRHQADQDPDPGPHQDLDRCVPEQLAQSVLLDAPHVHQVLHEPVQDRCLAAGGPPHPGGVVHHHERQDKGDREG